MAIDRENPSTIRHIQKFYSCVRDQLLQRARFGNGLAANFGCRPLMESRFEVSRYCRSYPNHEEQYSDAHGRPLFSLIPTMEQASQLCNLSQAAATIAHCGTWSAISRSARVTLSLILRVLTHEDCEFSIQASSPGDTQYTLVGGRHRGSHDGRKGCVSPGPLMRASRFLPSPEVWVFATSGIR